MAALDGRVFVDHGTKEARNTGCNKRGESKAEYRRAKVPVILEIAAILDEDERDQSD